METKQKFHKIEYHPGLTLGIVGGGQLGRMMIFEAKKLGLHVVTLDPKPNAPAGQVADGQIQAPFDDVKAYRELGEVCDLVTYEFEHISVEGLRAIEEIGTPVRPNSTTLEKIQHKGKQKTHLKDYGIHVPGFQLARNMHEVEKAMQYLDYPVMAKTCRGGYDGKGNILLQSEQDFKQLKSYFDRSGEWMLEEYMPFEKEVSVMAALNTWGEKVIYPLGENTHKDEILRATKVPASVEDSIQEKARQMGSDILDLFNEPGIYGIEMFLLPEGSLTVNEIAPRVHNSGHYTMEACNICQFATHLRCILGLPLIEPLLEKPVWMINLLGTSTGELPVKDIQGYESLFREAGVYLHLYGKAEIRPQRKMGHINITGKNQAQIEEKLRRIYLETEEVF